MKNSASIDQNSASMASLASRPASLRGAFLRVVCPYAGFAALWILLSDLLVGAWFTNPAMIVHWSIIKGWLFVLATSLLLFGLLARELRIRQRTESVLRTNETQLRRILDNMQDAYVQTDTTGRFVMVSPAAVRMYGYASADELIGQSSAMLYANNADRESVLAEIQQHGRVLDRVGLGRKKDGSTFWVSLNAQQLKDEEGRPTGIEGFMRDITERKRAEEQLYLQSAMLQAAANGIVIADRKGKLLWVNDAFTALTGYTADEAIGQNPRLLKSDRHDQAFYANMWDTILAGKVWHGELVNKRKDGTLYTEEMTITPVRSAQGEVSHFIAIKQDVTTRHDLEESLRQSQKMESIGRLAGGIAHDFNNILQTILGFNELLLTSMPPDDIRRADLEEIHKAATRAADLTHQLLAFSRKQTLKPCILDLNHSITDSEKMLRRLLGEDIQLTLQLAPHLHRTQADPGQISQIILNLAINARDAMPDGGRLTISTNNVTFELEDLVTMPEAQAGDFVCLAIADTGGGMSPEVQKHIFEPFFTTKGTGKGTGLGLAVIYGIVKQSNGWIHVYSKEGQGTTFKIYLPAQATVQPMQSEPSKIAALPTTGRGERILLVEDEAGVRHLAYRLCLAAGYDVVACASAKEALAHWAHEQGRFDLLFSDVVLPDRSGIDLASHLVTEHPHLPVLLCSGYSDERLRWAAIEQHGFHFLQKPYPAAVLRQTIHRILGSHPLQQ